MATLVIYGTGIPFFNESETNPFYRIYVTWYLSHKTEVQVSGGLEAVSRKFRFDQKYFKAPITITSLRVAERFRQHLTMHVEKFKRQSGW